MVDEMVGLELDEGVATLEPELDDDMEEAPVSARGESKGGDEPTDDATQVGEETEGEAEDGESIGTSRGRLDGILESLLLAAGAPLTIRRIVEILDRGTSKEVKASLERLGEHYGGAESGIHLVQVAGGYQFRTAPQNLQFVRSLLREKPVRLGRAALETLSIVAYKQPATRAEIEAIRGVDAESAVSTLLSKKLIKIVGRKEVVGRPLMYGTTPEFLEIFGLKDLKDLPTLKEIGPVPEPEDETDGEEEALDREDAEEANDEAADFVAGAEGQATAAGREDTDEDLEEAIDEAADFVSRIEERPTAAGERAIEADPGERREGAEDPQPGGSELEAGRGGDDSPGARLGEWDDGDPVGDPGAPGEGPDRD
jgi:segregation and condensation protein B